MSLLAPILLACGGRKLRGEMGGMGGMFSAIHGHFPMRHSWRAWAKQKGDEVLGGFVSLIGGVQILLQRLVQHEVDLVVAQGLLEVGDVGILVNLDILDAQHLGKVLPVLLVDVVGEG